MKIHHPSYLTGRRFSLAGMLLCSASLACAQNWTVQTLSTGRISPGGQPATVAIAVPPALPLPQTLPVTTGGTTAPSGEVLPTTVAPTTASPPVRHVLIYPYPSSTPQLKISNGTTTNTNTLGGVWMRSLPYLQTHGVSLVYVDVSSDAAGRSMISRVPREVRQDLAAVVKEAKQLFPGAQIHLAGLVQAAPLLDVADELEGLGKVVLTSSMLENHRTSDWSGLRKPVLMLQAPSAQCDPAPFIEAQEQSRRSRFTFVQVGYERQTLVEDCSRTSQHALYGREAEVAKAVADWLDGKEPPAVIGFATPQIAWREEVITYQAPATFGTNKLEATLLLPEVRRFGAGPYPVMVFNHGDIGMDSAQVKYKARYRSMVMAREFLQLGVAVLMPSRRGVGKSEGTYSLNFSTGDADATYKARAHAEDVWPALAWLKTRPELDANRIVIAGQSAGGYTAMYMASQNPGGVVGAIDFSGGRTDMSNTGAGHLNQMMVRGFAELGKETRIPTFWVFAENDTRYTANTIRASHEAFQGAGGKARLLLAPAIEGDGHFIHQKPSLWRAALKEYLAEIGVTNNAK